MKVKVTKVTESTVDVDTKEKITSPEKVHKIISEILASEPDDYAHQEHLWIIVLNTASVVLQIKLVSIGGWNQATVPIPEILRSAIVARGTNMILVHNHPSGNTTPSSHDDTVTRALNLGCEAVGIRLLDSVIIGEDGFFSYVENGKL